MPPRRTSALRIRRCVASTAARIVQKQPTHECRRRPRFRVGALLVFVTLPTMGERVGRHDHQSGGGTAIAACMAAAEQQETRRSGMPFPHVEYSTATAEFRKALSAMSAANLNILQFGCRPGICSRSAVRRPSLRFSDRCRELGNEPASKARPVEVVTDGRREAERAPEP